MLWSKSPKTLTADAREYRETLSLEKEMSDNNDKFAEWEKRQLVLEDKEYIDEENELLDK